jgi:hypothetical protein
MKLSGSGDTEIRPVGKENLPLEDVEVNEEIQRVTEETEQLNLATFKSDEYVELTGDYKEAEEIEESFEAAIDPNITSLGCTPSEVSLSQGEGDLDPTISPVSHSDNDSEKLIQNIMGEVETSSDPSEEDDSESEEEAETGYDSLGGISEEMSLKLQMQMERKQKKLQTLSNTIKKISDTGDSIVKNTK